MMNTVIQKISARQVLDCKARPMLEVDVFTQDGSMGRGAAPTGTSVGAHEAFVLRDYDVNEFNGLSVHKERVSGNGHCSGTAWNGCSRSAGN